jgi:3D (Asp-Asp-Asp) domain-containing protein
MPKQAFRLFITNLLLLGSAQILMSCIRNEIRIDSHKEEKIKTTAAIAEKKNTEELLGPESGMWCPEGFKFNTLYKLCTDGKEAAGPFSAQMIATCKQESPSGVACEGSKWPLELAKRLRGTTDCPTGTGMDETLGVCAAGNEVFGPFPTDLIAFCHTSSPNNPQCTSMRWDRKILANAGLPEPQSPGTKDSGAHAIFPQEPSTSEKGRKFSLWATNYFLETASDIADGLPLRRLDGSALGPKLERKKWCSAAMEGSVRIISGNWSGKTFNYDGKSDEYRVNCSAFYNHPASGGVKFREARGPYGDGVLTYNLVPYRSIATDRSRIPHGSAIFIPAARGITIKNPDGSTFVHDGYFFAADSGGLIKGNHIDVFTGENKESPFGFVKSTKKGVFDAWEITNPSSILKLRTLHIKK